MGKTSPSCFVPGVKRDEMILAQAGGQHTHITGHNTGHSDHQAKLAFLIWLTCPVMLMYCMLKYSCVCICAERENREPTSEMETLLSLGYETLLCKSVTCGVWRSVQCWLRALSALPALTQLSRLWLSKPDWQTAIIRHSTIFKKYSFILQ